jgi:hypothetical protein|mmetsp:Transcript_7374/g.11097  ORF Transcript_7374/g.11097 Transcript_7374/m.11097 type:complete len:319 (-) Transcript_7374:381-1337(-)|eukprot:CAMPEP_0113934036 /NCGR_PEP_ID=MMETSP1339-20121228/1369_1 /TAXON_ID=94617 /ORGANISM="Fibrocapsa japonica" /LENGTH=318 /DNA_ID=CAMNT_0000935647 /DNA_START=114 /DNA_END=1070 /DNA_ORIENTATION=- /assembly_acc=CAM_ASM_000762
MAPIFSRALLALGCVGLSLAQTDLPAVYPGEGTAVELHHDDVSLQLDAEFDGDKGYVLAHGAGSRGILKFKQDYIDNFGLTHHSFGIQFDFHVSKALNQHTYGFILGVGGNPDCVTSRLDKLSDEANRVFVPDEKFCKGITVAGWSDEAAADQERDSRVGFYISVGGIRRAFIPMVDFLDKWMVMTVHVNRQEGIGGGTFDVYVDDDRIGENYSFVEEDMEGDGEKMFIYGKAADTNDGSNVVVSDIMLKTTKDMNPANLYVTDSLETSYNLTPITSVASVLFVGIIAIVAQNAYRKHQAQVQASQPEAALLLAVNSS